MLVGTRYFQTNTGRILTRSGWLDTSFRRVVTWIFVNIFFLLHRTTSCWTCILRHISTRYTVKSETELWYRYLAFWCLVCSVLLGSIFVSIFEPQLAGHFARKPDTETEVFRLSFWLVHILKTFSENCYTKNQESFNQFPWRQQLRFAESPDSVKKRHDMFAWRNL